MSCPSGRSKKRLNSSGMDMELVRILRVEVTSIRTTAGVTVSATFAKASLKSRAGRIDSSET